MKIRLAWLVTAGLAVGCAESRTEEPPIEIRQVEDPPAVPPVVEEPPAPPPVVENPPPVEEPPPPVVENPPPVEEPPPPAANPAGPWPTDALTSFTARFGLGSGVRHFGVDDAHNVWLLRSGQVGVLRPGDSAPTWSELPGQARRGFPVLSMCGGSAGRAYVGYQASDPLGETSSGEFRADGTYLGDPSRLDGDVDALRLQPDGSVRLEAHVMFSNSNAIRFDENRSFYACTKVMEGPLKGELYWGTNHSVTRVREPQGPWPTGARREYDQRAFYADHRHPVWFDDYVENGVQQDTLVYGTHHGVSITPEGRVLMANTWKLGMLTPKLDPNGVAPLLAEDGRTRLEGGGTWEWTEKSPFELDLERVRLDASATERDKDTQPKDEWRAVAQTYDTLQFFAGSATIGLWHFRRASPTSVSSAIWTRVDGPSSNITQLAATKDGSLYIGTGGSGLWKLDVTAARATLAAGSGAVGTHLTRVEEVAGGTVLQMFYDPSVTPSALYVLTSSGLFVLRGP